MQFIKNVIAYRIELPALSELEEGMHSNEFTECLPSQDRSYGFAPFAEHEAKDLIALAGSDVVAMAVRIDTKTVPADVVKKELAAECDKIYETTGRRPGKKEQRNIKEEIVARLLPQAFPRSKRVNVFYHVHARLLLVAGTQAQADLVTTLLVKSSAAVKTTTIYVNDLRQGLTTRLKRYLGDPIVDLSDEGDDRAFYPFMPTGSVDLTFDKQRASYKLEDLSVQADAVRETLQRRFSVAVIGLQLASSPVTFRLDEKLNVKSINYGDVFDETPPETALAQAQRETQIVVDIINRLCGMFGFAENNP